MDTVEIHSRTAISLAQVEAKLSRRLRLTQVGVEPLVVEESNSRVYVHHPKAGSSGLLESQLWLDYSSVALIKRVIELMADDPALVVDNGFGAVLPGDEFAARIRSEPDWDWRKEIVPRVRDE